MRAQFTTCFFLFLNLIGWSQTQLHLEDFESLGGYTTSIPEFTDGSEDYFIRTDGSNLAGAVNLSNIQGSYFFGAQDIDGEGASLPVFLTINGISINGYSNLELRVYLAEDDDGSNEDWDASDYVHFNASVAGGPTTNVLWIENDGSTFNSAPQIDTDFDGIGDGAIITDNFTLFTAPISGTGNSLDLTIEFNLNAGDEDIAIDHIEVYGVQTCTPATISSITPNSGPEGTLVTINGSGFNAGTGTSAVQFGSTNATSFNVISNTQIEAEVPANGDGNVTVTTDNCNANSNLFTFLETSGCSNGATDLFISEVYDAASGGLAYIELFNGTANPINLANYDISAFYNGNASAQWTASLSGNINPNSTVVYSFGGSSTGALAIDHLSIIGINNNDCLHLLKNGTSIDIWGECNGTAWVVGGSAGYSYIRNPTVTTPTTTFTSSEWIALNTETLDSLNAHTFNSPPPAASITSQPTDVTVCEDDNNQFQASTSSGSYTYQWYEQSGSGNWSALTNSGIYSGVQTNNLSLNTIPVANNNNQYYLEIQDGSCTVPSVAVQLTVNALPTSTNIFHNP